MGFGLITKEMVVFDKCIFYVFSFESTIQYSIFKRPFEPSLVPKPQFNLKVNCATVNLVLRAESHISPIS